ncbi:S1C family serine protease [Alicyclobacillus fastidiosus]|nr:trypsin-like peptidase domain-containing protein [Alicyclobacillus fastidiosus]
MVKKAQTSVRPKRTSTGLPNFVTLVQRYKKAVMGIEVVQSLTTGRGLGPRPLFPWDRSQPRQGRSAMNIGTGFVFHPRGYILTNEHVVSDGDRIMLRVFGKKDLVEAQVVGRNRAHDIAILSADIPIPSPILKIGQGKDVHVGEWVLAIGSPLGLDNTVTVGIVSAKNRPLQIGDREYPNLIQTDAAINRGNSGGPLINLRGEVVGMNTAVSQSSQGIGFAISADVLRKEVDHILKNLN